MQNFNERPVCHRTEDLVTYLYGEASEAAAKDFAGHLQQCDACHSEFGIFEQVHDSIMTWRNDALGSAFSAAPVSVVSTVDSTQFVRHERKLSALAALREFFSVSPLWLRAATGLAALLLCVLGVLTISRSGNRPVQVASKEAEPRYSKQDVERAVQKRVDELNNQRTSSNVKEAATSNNPADNGNRNQLAVNRVQPRTPRSRGLSRQERVQLAADLRLIPRDEDELPFGLSDEPNQ